MGLLVEALRDRGVEAEGVDISEYASAQAREDVRPHLRVGSITEPFPRSYDLVVCIETLEHLPRADAERAVENICRHTDDVLFSSTPAHFKEATHVNVQPPEHWAELFARQGFFRDFGTDPSTYLSRWAVRFRRSDEPTHRLVAQYEGRLWRLADEAGELRDLAIENRGEVQRLVPKEAELEEIKASRAWRITVGARTLFRRILPRQGSSTPPGQRG
jgi:SAM-dependent methyltransferase